MTSTTPEGERRWTTAMASLTGARLAVAGVDDLVIAGFAEWHAELGDALEGSPHMVLLRAVMVPTEGDGSP